MIKKHLFKIFILVLILSLSFIGTTNSSLFDKETSNTNSFSAACWGAPDKPTRINPSEYANTGDIDFEWSATNNHCPSPHVWYNFQITDVSDFSTTLDESGYMQDTTNFSVTGLAAGEYWWRVQVKDQYDYSDFSLSFHLIIDQTAPTIPGPIGWTIENPPDGLDYDSGADFDRYATCGGAVNYSPMSNIWKPSTDATPIIYEREVYSPINNRIYFNNSLINNYENGGGAVDGTTYWVKVRAKDAVGNYSDWTSKCPVMYDTTKPESTITTPDNPGLGHTTSMINTPIIDWDGAIAGTASDTFSGVNRVELSINRLDTGEYWDGLNWIIGFETTVRVQATGTVNWTYNLSDHPTDVIYVITSHAVDNAGNIENSYVLIIENKSPSTQPTATLTLSEDKKTISFKVENISGYETLDYELGYMANGMERGIVGSEVDIIGQTEYEKNSLDLATCSNEVCTYDQNVHDFKLKITLEDKDGKQTILQQSL